MLETPHDCVHQHQKIFFEKIEHNLLSFQTFSSFNTVDCRKLWFDVNGLCFEDIEYWFDVNGHCFEANECWFDGRKHSFESSEQCFDAIEPWQKRFWC